MATQFVPTVEIEKLTTGSFEHLASKIDEAVKNSSQKMFGEVVPSHVERVGTFGNSAILASDDGRFAKVQFESAADGSLKIVSVEALTVPVYDDKNINDYLMQEARSIVNSVLAHDEGTAAAKLTALLPFVAEAVEPTELEMVAGIVTSIKADRPWKRIYRERTEQINGFMGDVVKEVEARRLPSKFNAMLDGLTEDKTEGHRELVLSDLVFMGENLSKLVAQIDAAGSLTEVNDATETEEDRALVTTFAAFSEDLKMDLQSIQAALVEAKESVKSVVGLGQLYDALAEESFRYEVASRFVAAMSWR
jgi:hypothetical protein